MYEMIFLKVHPANEREHEESSSGSNNALTVSLVYAGCHAAYRTVVATTVSSCIFVSFLKTLNVECGGAGMQKQPYWWVDGYVLFLSFSKKYTF